LVLFYQTFTQIISKWQNITLVQKRANRPTQINSQILKPFIYDFFGASFAIEVAVLQMCTFHVIYTHQHMSN
jgi:hypothetical protein